MFQSICLLLATVQAAVQAPSDAPPPATLCWGDFNGDGRTDLIALRDGAPRLFENLGEGEFADASVRAGLPELDGVRQAVWQDCDADGDLDLLLVAPAEGLHLLRNEGGRFTDVTSEAGLSELRGVARASFLELDGDALPDLWLAGPEGDRLLRQQPGGMFAAVALELPDDSAPQTGASAAPSVDGDTPDARAADGRAPVADGARAPAAGRSAGSDGLRERSDARELALGGVVVSGITKGATLPGLGCAPRLLDASTGSCLTASSLPTFGSLYPLGPELNIDAAGRVGMGTTAPSHRLTIQGAGSDDVARLIGTQGSFGHGAKLNFGDGDYAHLWEYDDDMLQLKAEKELRLTAGSGSTILDTDLFVVASSGGTRFAQGNVGIGAAAPQWPLDVLASQAVARLQTTNSSNGSVLELRSNVLAPSGVGAINFVNAQGQTNGQVAYTGSDALTMRTGGAERLRIASDGSTGIGTSVPIRKLHVNGGVGSGAILAETVNSSADAIIGVANLTGAGIATGVHGRSNMAGGTGVRGWATAASGASHGVSGNTNSRDGAGVRGQNYAQPTGGAATVTGVYGEVNTQYGLGVWGRNWATFGNEYNSVGVMGTGWYMSEGFGVFAEGKLGATGAKTFVQPIPGDPERMLEFVCLEGNEAGTYCRGQGRLAGGVARIPIPEDFRLATSGDGLTAQVTPRGLVRICVESVTLDELVVRGEADVAFDWTVNGVRRAFEDVETIVRNTVFVPRVRGVPYIPGATPEYRKLLVEAGITNEDGTPNEATAARLGWELLDPEDPRAAPHLPPHLRSAGDRSGDPLEVAPSTELEASAPERGD
jgi:hypothetical protein